MNKIVIFDNFDKPEASIFAEQATSFLCSNQTFCYVKNKTYCKFTSKINSNYLQVIDDDYVVKDADVIVTFGGDGTILTAADQYIYQEIPIMGFNLGKLGFLAEFSTTSLEESLRNLIHNKFKIISKSVLQTFIDEHIHIALNDFVISRKDHSKMITIKLLSNEQYVGDYRADGLIISTPTGSTAYSLSCGGPILCPDSNVFCVTPIAPHSLNLRPLVLSNDKEITLQLFSDEANISADGLLINILNFGETIKFSLFDKKIKIVVPQDSNYFEVLRRKLFWAEYSFGK